MSGPYRERSVVVPSEPCEPRERWRCLVCFRTDCAVHGKRNAKALGHCNHDDDAKSPRVACAHCGAAPKNFRHTP